MGHNKLKNEDDEELPENVEAVLKSLGGFGRFQAILLFLLLCCEIPMSIMLLLPVFIDKTATRAPPDTWQCGNETVSKAKACECQEDLLAVDSTSSLVSEWNLVCNSAWVSDTMFTGQWVGILIGNIFASQLSDKYGRRRPFFILGIIMACGTIATAASMNPYIYLVARFFCGVGYAASINILTSYAMEFMQPQWRHLISALSPVGFGMMLLAVLGYSIQSWRYLALSTAAPFVMFIFVFIFVPESPRWLLKKQRVEDCHKAFDYIGRVNGKDSVMRPAVQHLADLLKVDDTGKSMSTLDIYRNKDLRRRLLSLQGLWFTRALTYFGITYNVNNQSADPYMTLVYMGIVDIVAEMSSLLITNRLGRRRSFVLTMTITAIFLVVIATMEFFVDFKKRGILLMILCLCARYGTAAARAIARTLTAELFITEIRTKATGLAKVPGSVAGGLATQIVLLGSYWPSVPFFTLAVVGTAGSFLAFLLEEPAWKQLEEKISSGENANKNPT